MALGRRNARHKSQTQGPDTYLEETAAADKGSAEGRKAVQRQTGAQYAGHLIAQEGKGMPVWMG